MARKSKLKRLYLRKKWVEPKVVEEVVVEMMDMVHHMDLVEVMVEAMAVDTAVAMVEIKAGEPLVVDMVIMVIIGDQIMVVIMAVVP